MYTLLPGDDLSVCKAIIKGQEIWVIKRQGIWVIQGTPYEQNCVVLVRPYRTNHANMWQFDSLDIPSELSYACKTWWNHYQAAFTLQKFLEDIL